MNEVTILGGGLAGLCLALQLKDRDEDLKVTVLERRRDPPPPAAFKIGESSVEIGSDYLLHKLGLRTLLENELPKYGLRFFFSDGRNRDVASRLELGPSEPSAFPAYHLDRGSFEAALTRRCLERGIDLRLGCKVTDVALGDPHVIEFDDGAGTHRERSRWVVDASGRAALLKRHLELTRKNRHGVHSAWFRMDRAFHPDAWSSDRAFRERLSIPRRLSTNHLVGTGYWMWIIPLKDDRTSVGLLADGALHPFHEYNTFDRLRAWLARHEPMFADLVDADLDLRMDFQPFKRVSYGARRVLSDARWALTGDASLFLDPLYSPGNDFIGICNTYIVDLITRDRRGQELATLAEVWDTDYRNLYQGFMPVYQRQYAMMGHSRVMTLKVLWDFAVYWGFLCQLAIHAKLTDPEFMGAARDILLKLAGLNANVQRSLRQWAASTPDDPRPGYVDYVKIPFLRGLNRALLDRVDDGGLLARLQHNLALLHTLRAGLLALSGRGPRDREGEALWALPLEQLGMASLA